MIIVYEVQVIPTCTNMELLCSPDVLCENIVPGAEEMHYLEVGGEISCSCNSDKTWLGNFVTIIISSQQIRIISPQLNATEA